MPTYEFHCERCKGDFEVVSSMDEHERMKKDKDVKCTRCGSTDVVPQISHFDVRTSRKSA